MEKIGYTLLVIVALCWLCAMITGMVLAFPFGIIGLIAIIGIGFLLIKVLADRLSNKEDDHYSQNVDQ